MGHDPKQKPPPGKKWCPGCETFKGHRSFTGTRGRCRQCTKDQKRSYSLRRKYQLELDEYYAIKEGQGGKCAICQRATGKTRALAVDHDHSCCSGSDTCGECVRGLLCFSCNRMVGFLRDDPEAFIRAANYLTNPPAQRILKEMRGKK